MHYRHLQRLSGIRMGHLITSKEVAKCILRAVNLILVSFILKIKFSSRERHNALSRAVWCLQSWCGSGTYSGFAASCLGVAPHIAEPRLAFTDEIIAWLPICCMVSNMHIPNECLGRVYLFPQKIPTRVQRPISPVCWGVLVGNEAQSLKRIIWGPYLTSS